MRYSLATTAFAALAVSALAAAPGHSETFGFANVIRRAEDLEDAYDYVIVGAGTAGLTLADRLTEDGTHTVLVIEFGDLVPDSIIARSNHERDFLSLTPTVRYNITSIPQPGMNNRSQDVIMGCAVGGSSAINGMLLLRGTKDEYDGWAELGEAGSTWNWEGLWPYMKKTTQFNAPSEVQRKEFNITWNESVWDVGERGRAKGRVQASFPSYTLPSLQTEYEAMAAMPNVRIPIDGASGQNGLFWNPSSMDNVVYNRSYARIVHYDNITRDNYHVLTLHKANKVLLNETAAIGVDYTPRGMNMSLSIYARKEVILSAGAIHTPQILQRSGVGDKRLLAKANIETVIDIPGVGQNFQDHSLVYLTYKWGDGKGPSPNISQLGGDPNTYASPNLGAWLGLPDYAANFSSLISAYKAQSSAQYLPTDTHPDVLAGYAAFKTIHTKLMATANVNFLWVALDGTPGGFVISEHVLSSGSVTLNPQDIHGEPRVDYRALSNPIDLDIMIENIAFMRRYMAAPLFAPYAPIEVSPGLNVTGEALKAWVREAGYAPTAYHPVGTSSMRKREWGGVVDKELRVFGIENLRVCDAGVMPFLPGANTQQSTYALAEKAADIIRAGW